MNVIDFALFGIGEIDPCKRIYHSDINNHQ